jgi:hypothetical protein
VDAERKRGANEVAFEDLFDARADDQSTNPLRPPGGAHSIDSISAMNTRSFTRAKRTRECQTEMLLP